MQSARTVLEEAREGSGLVQSARIELEEAREGSGQVQSSRIELEEAREGSGQVQSARIELEEAREEWSGQEQSARIELEEAREGFERNDRIARNHSVFEAISNGYGFTGSFQKLFEQLRQENICLMEYMGKMQKALDASDLKGTEKILLENASLRRHTEELTEEVAQKDEQIELLNDIVKELSDNEGNTDLVVRQINEGEHSEPCLINNDEGTMARPLYTENAVLEDDDVVLEAEFKEDSATNGIQELVTMKNSGSIRESPQVQAKPKPAPRRSIKDYKCDICKLVRASNEKLKKHMSNHTDEGDWTCDDCSYQSNDQNPLLDHMLEKSHSSVLLKHLLNQNMYERKDKCGFCNQIFTSKRQLLDHKKIEHKTYQPCRNLNNCSWGEDCLYNHNPVN